MNEVKNSTLRVIALIIMSLILLAGCFVVLRTTMPWSFWIERDDPGLEEMRGNEEVFRIEIGVSGRLIREGKYGEAEKYLIATLDDFKTVKIRNRKLGIEELDALQQLKQILAIEFQNDGEKYDRLTQFILNHKGTQSAKEASNIRHNLEDG